MLDLTDYRDVAKRKPLLIAHRGGVVARDAPENSLAAVSLASERGYDMVELDVRASKDQVPVLFHGLGYTDDLFVDCAIDRRLEELTAEELSKITYRLTDQPIASLSDALQLCARLGLGVMLDIKVPNPSDLFLGRISELIIEEGLASATMTLNVSDEIEERLQDVCLFPVDEAGKNKIRHGENLDLDGRYYFDWGARITEGVVRTVRESGSFVIATINSFHYPRHVKRELARQDTRRLLNADVDGFQLDDEFRDLLPDRP